MTETITKDEPMTIDLEAENARLRQENDELLGRTWPGLRRVNAGADREGFLVGPMPVCIVSDAEWSGDGADVDARGRP